MVQTSILTTPWSAFWFSSRYKLRPSFSVWEALPVSPRDSCTCSVRVSADTNHICKLCFMCSIGATHQNLLQFKSPRLWGESPLKCWSSELDLHWKSATHFNVSPFLLLISLSLFFRVVQSTILPPSTLNPGFSEAWTFFSPLKTNQDLTNQPRVFPQRSAFLIYSLDSFDSSTVLAPPPASQPLLPLPRWKLTANPTAIRFHMIWLVSPQKFPTCLSPVRLIMASSSLASCRHEQTTKNFCLVEWGILAPWVLNVPVCNITNLVPWSNWNTNHGWIEDSSRVLAKSPTPENPPKCISFSITWH